MHSPGQGNGLVSTVTGVTPELVRTGFVVSALPLAGLYTVVAITQAVALGLFWNQPGPALVGFVVMGGISAAYWWKMHRQNFARFALRRVRRI